MDEMHEIIKKEKERVREMYHKELTELYDYEIQQLKKCHL